MSLNILDQIEKQLNPQKVSIIEFAESSEFCNKPLYPRQEVLLKLWFLEELTGEEEDILDYWINGGYNGTEILISPNIRDRVEWLRENGYTHFKEIILPGGRRSSKGFCTGIAMAKIMYDTLQLQDPGTYYGIDPTKDIQFACVAGSEQQAKEFQYSDFSETIVGCPAFEPYLVKSLETEIRVATEIDLRKMAQSRMTGNKIQKDIARLRGKALAANAGTLRGMAAMVLTVDEVAHMIEGESKASAEEVYKAAKPALGQFGVDSLVFLNSSPYTKVGLFYERHMGALVPFNKNVPVDEREFTADDEEAAFEPTNGNPRIMTFEFPSWALYDGYQESKKHKFKHVLMASPEWDETESKWSKDDILKIREARAEESANPDSFKVEWRGKFAEVTDAFLNPTMVDRAFSGVPNGEWANEPGKSVPRPMLNPLSTNRGEGARYSNRYKFHLDPSSTTAGFGFAIAHTETFEKFEGGVEEHVVFDMIKRWLPKDFGGNVIKWQPILEEVMMYADIFRPFEITFDQHNSVQPIQELSEKLQAKNVVTRVYEKPATNELNWKRWETFKTVLYQGLIHAPNDTIDTEWAALELKFLQENRTGGKFPRVDRQEIGPVQSKDMADCMAECTYTLVGNLYMNRTLERLSQFAAFGGAPGGYGIGFSGLPRGPQGGPGPPGINEYYSHKDRHMAENYINPARGVLGRGRGRGRNSSRGRY